MAASMRIVIEDDSLDRLFVQTEPGTELVPFRPGELVPVDGGWRGCGAERGEYEDRTASEAA